LLEAVIAVIVLVWEVSIATAGQVQTLPSQQNLPAPDPSLQPFTNQNPENGMTIPPTLPGGQGATREIPLPEVFHGCWRGTVPQVDSIVPLDPDAGGTVWLTKSYTLCYKQAGYAGKWVLTFAQGAVADPRQVRDQRQAIRVKSVDGPNRAEITAYLQFLSRSVNIFGVPTGIVNEMDELSHLHCYVLPDQQVMEVRATVFVETNGRPAVNIAWHTRFFRSPA
jgi:hypothetical protein